MRANIEFLVISCLVSLFVDWVFQWDWQAVNKSKWIKGNYHMAALAVVTHSFIYTGIVTIVLSILGVIPIEKQTMVAVVLLVSHTIIDTRILVKWIMRFKGIKWEQINDYKNFGFMHIGIDHRLHELVLLILAFII